MKGKKNVVNLILTAVCVTFLFVGASPVFAEDTLKVGAYGGYFKDSFDKHIFPDFTKDTGLKVESVAEPTGEAWLVQLEQAAKAGVAPADVSMMAQVAMLRGQRNELWMQLNKRLNQIEPQGPNQVIVGIRNDCKAGWLLSRRLLIHTLVTWPAPFKTLEQHMNTCPEKT